MSTSSPASSSETRKEDSWAHGGQNPVPQGEPYGAASRPWEQQDAAHSGRDKGFGSSLHDAEMAFSSTLSEKREDVKADRTAAKRAVTLAAKRLTTGISRQMITVPEMARELDEKYCRFIDLCDAFSSLALAGNPEDAVVNGLGLEEYERETDSVYRDAADRYRAFAESKPLKVGTSSLALFEETRKKQEVGEGSILDSPTLAKPQAFPNAPQTTISAPTQIGTHNHRPTQPQTPSLVQLKRREIPRFDGERSNWPEFREQWQQLVVPAVGSPVALATDLKNACKGGKAWREIENISAGAPGAYGQMWEALCSYYDNVTLSVDAAMEELKRVRKVREGDHEGTVELIRTVEKTFNQLAVLDQIELVSNREIAGVVAQLPPLLAREWAEFQYKLPPLHQLRPFRYFYTFLKEKQPMLRYLADTGKAGKGEGVERSSKPAKVYRVNTDDAPSSRPSSRSSSRLSPSPSSPSSSSSSSSSPAKKGCPLHPRQNNHNIEDCLIFKFMTIKDRRALCAEEKLCFVCFSNAHWSRECTAAHACERCRVGKHHKLLCYAESEKGDNASERKPSQSSSGHGSTPTRTFTTSQNTKGESPFYAIFSVPVTSSSQKAIVFCDDGSEATFISSSAVRKLKAKKLRPTRIEMATLTSSKEIDTYLYEVTLVTKAGRKCKVVAIALPELAGEANQLDIDALDSIFPDFDCVSLQRPKGEIDVLLGSDYFGLHPKHEIASDGKNLSIMQGDLGVCLQGLCPVMKGESVCASHSIKVVTSNFVNSLCGPSHPHLAGSSVHKKAQCMPPEGETPSKQANQVSFLFAEDLGTTVDPRCGSCKCGKCPLPGHTYSFREEQELKEIRENLKYDDEKECWTTSYPWLVDPSQLPNNYQAAFATLRSTEKRLQTDESWKQKYSEQIQDMADRGVARKLTKEEVSSWKGPVFYLSHLAVENPKSTSTPVRIVFNSSQPYKGMSLNSCLAKGPDSYRTNLLGVLLRFREEPVVLIGDIRKMYNSVYLEMLEQHTHRFLWRDLQDRPPDVWCVTRVNMGDKPAGAIAVEAKDLTAERFKEISPKASSFIVGSAYVDDLIDSVPTEEAARTLASDAETILQKGGFKLKDWFFGGVGVNGNVDSEIKQVLGVSWNPEADEIIFKPCLNFSAKKRGIRSGPDLKAEQVPEALPSTLTRRRVLEQVMGIYDPLGILSPFLLKAKVLLRESWIDQLGWDDPLPESLVAKWNQFFVDLFQVERISFARCLRPQGSVGKPQLIMLSDGSEVAYGCAAYVRWTMADGGFWCRLIMGKCRIAPVNRVSIPQMELNGAVLSKRIRQVILKECRYSFSSVLHLIDSETVLKMINKVSTRFKVYEGVRIGEIQAAGGSWGWVPGKLNIADWVTRCHSPGDLGPESEWYKGPAFLYLPMDEWQVKFLPEQVEGPLPGEKKHFKVAQVEVAKDSYKRCSRLRTTKWALARIICMLRARSFAEGRRSNVTAQLLVDAELILVKEAQSVWTEEDVKDQFRDLHPVMQDGVWVVGTRISHASPLTPENRPQILVPYGHPLCAKLMEECHKEGGHKGRDATLSRFRARFWTSRASKLSMKICGSCQTCKRMKAKGLQQIMGPMPSARLSPAPPFSHTMADLFGPFPVRGEVQKRTTAKAWGVIFTDLCCRAVHLEVANGYDAQSFLLAFRRFASIRGWPAVMYSDPGTQLRASAEVICRASENGTRWEFSPPDSPWRQGAVEALIKTVKQSLQLATEGKRLSLPETLTIFSEAANLVNERPIGTLSGSDSVLSVLTPNSLLLGRSTAANPGGYRENGSVHGRLVLLENIVQQFWQQWTQLYAPTLLRHTKWKEEHRCLKVGDVVLVMDNINISFKGKYRLARVVEIFPGPDGIVRKVKLAFKNFKVGEKMHEYQGQPDTNIERSVQRLILLVPVD